MEQAQIVLAPSFMNNVPYLRERRDILRYLDSNDNLTSLGGTVVSSFDNNIIF